MRKDLHILKKNREALDFKICLVYASICKQYSGLSKESIIRKTATVFKVSTSKVYRALQFSLRQTGSAEVRPVGCEQWDRLKNAGSLFLTQKNDYE